MASPVAKAAVSDRPHSDYTLHGGERFPGLSRRCSVLSRIFLFRECDAPKSYA